MKPALKGTLLVIGGAIGLFLPIVPGIVMIVWGVKILMEIHSKSETKLEKELREY